MKFVDILYSRMFKVNDWVLVVHKYTYSRNLNNARAKRVNYEQFRLHCVASAWLYLYKTNYELKVAKQSEFTALQVAVHDLLNELKARV